MGRKPNALILQHFERGAKLNDSSNRYEHTCKACGERFPKGRIDSLTAHLLKKCPGITTRERQKAALQLNNLPISPDLTEAARARNSEMLMPNGSPVEMQLGWPSDFTALEALAEVSRQVDMNEKRDDRSVNNRSVGHGSRASEPPRADRLEIQEQYTVDNPPVSYEQRVQKDKKVVHPKAPRRQSEASLRAATLAYQRMVPSRETSPNLTSMAAAAAARFVPSMVDPQLLGEDVNRARQDTIAAKAIEQELKYEAVPNMDEPFFQTSTEAASSSAWPLMESSDSHMYSASTEPIHSGHGFGSNSPVQATPNHSSFPRPLVMQPMTTEFSAEYGNGQKSNKPKVRGHFKPDRRLQVQQVRKIGACLRCRMLKKPCTQGTPCETCTNVDRARLWQDQCIRAKLPEVLQMYNAGLHYTLSYHETNLAKSQNHFVPSLHMIDVSHFPDQHVYASFECLEGQDIPGGPGTEVNPNSRRLLKSDEFSQKLANYARAILPAFISKEASHFMKVTLEYASTLFNKYHNDSLGQAIELWVIVQTLVDSNTAWVLSERDRNQAPGAGIIIDKSAGDHTYDDICGQLNAAAEKKASHLSKDVLGDFEKQMINRNNQKAAFDYFLIAIIVLNCVEKSMWLFKSWENDDFKSRWPLDKAPDHFVSQGEQLAKILNTLLRTRSTPPRTFTTVDGILAAERGLLAADGDDASSGFQYFNDLQLNTNEVMDKATNYTFEPGNCRCFDFRLTSKIILPLQST